MIKDDVALALNHVDEWHRTTDIYIEKNWSIVDEVQEKALSLLTSETQAYEELECSIKTPIERTNVMRYLAVFVTLIWQLQIFTTFVYQVNQIKNLSCINLKRKGD